MKHLSLVVFAIFTQLVTLNVFAEDAIFIACYGQNSQLSMSFDPEQKIMTYAYELNNNDPITFLSEPSSWGDAFSSITITGNGLDIVQFKAQIISGDPETPIIETSAEVTMRKLAGQEGYILFAGTVVHNSETLPLQSLIGANCYVR